MSKAECQDGSALAVETTNGVFADLVLQIRHHLDGERAGRIESEPARVRQRILYATADTTTVSRLVSLCVDG
jgi:hypothetical protein